MLIDLRPNASSLNVFSLVVLTLRVGLAVLLIPLSLLHYLNDLGCFDLVADQSLDSRNQHLPLELLGLGLVDDDRVLEELEAPVASVA
jgi:hypothetical protein